MQRLAAIIIIIIIYCYTTRVAHDTYMYIHMYIITDSMQYASSTGLLECAV